MNRIFNRGLIVSVLLVLPLSTSFAAREKSKKAPQSLSKPKSYKQAIIHDIDNEHSTLGFTATAASLLEVDGTFKDFSGYVTFDHKKKLIKAAEGLIQVKSVNTNNLERDAHLQQSDFFDAPKYPTMYFKLISHSPSKKKIMGTLTIHGKSKIITLENVKIQTGKNEDTNGRVVKIKAETVINRTHFNVGTGFKGFFVHKNVDITVKIRAEQPPPQG